MACTSFVSINWRALSMLDMEETGYGAKISFSVESHDRIVLSHVRSETMIEPAPNTIVDREKRDRLADAIERYLRDEITNHELDPVVEEFLGDTDDPALGFIARQISCFYDEG